MLLCIFSGEHFEGTFENAEVLFESIWFINRMGMLHRMLILVEIGQFEYIDKMGKLYRMLILRA